RFAVRRSRNARIAATRWAMGVAAQPGCAARARSYFLRTAKAPSSGVSESRAPVAGLKTFMRGRPSRTGSAKKVVEQRSGVEQRRIARVVKFGMPLHAE